MARQIRPGRVIDQAAPSGRSAKANGSQGSAASERRRITAPSSGGGISWPDDAPAFASQPPALIPARDQRIGPCGQISSDLRSIAEGMAVDDIIRVVAPG